MTSMPPDLDDLDLGGTEIETVLRAARNRCSPSDTVTSDSW
ncbi:hypothetical protein [Saccharopolyspora hattusasensis]